MRILLLALALVLVFAIAVAADEIGQLSSAFSLTTPSAPQARQFELRPPGTPRHFRISDPARLDLGENDDATFTASGPISLPGGHAVPENTCYRMRAFQVKRIDNTDATMPSGYTTCLSANRAQLKNASGGGK